MNINEAIDAFDARLGSPCDAGVFPECAKDRSRERPASRWGQLPGATSGAVRPSVSMHVGDVFRGNESVPHVRVHVVTDKSRKKRIVTLSIDPPFVCARRCASVAEIDAHDGHWPVAVTTDVAVEFAAAVMAAPEG